MLNIRWSVFGGEQIEKLEHQLSGLRVKKTVNEIQINTEEGILRVSQQSLAGYGTIEIRLQSRG